MARAAAHWIKLSRVKQYQTIKSIGGIEALVFVGRNHKNVYACMCVYLYKHRPSLRSICKLLLKQSDIPLGPVRGGS